MNEIHEFHRSGKQKFSESMKFIDSEKFASYVDRVLVGDCYGYGTGHLYMFKLNSERTGFVFEDPRLTDFVVNRILTDDRGVIPEPMDEIVIGQDLGCITDIEFGPDGSLYVVSFLNGRIYKVIPNDDIESPR